MITTTTNFRISLFGGGSDLPHHFEEYGGEVLGFGIDKYCRISVRRLPPFFDYTHRIVHSQIELVKEIADIKHPAVRESLFLHEPPYGVEIHHSGDLPARSGLGSSSSFVVGLLNALTALKGYHASPQVLVESAIHIERERLGENVGSQDQVWAAHGGFNRITFNPDHSYELRPVIISADRKQELQDHLLLFFTGLSRNSTDIAAEQVKNGKSNAAQLKEMQSMVSVAYWDLIGPRDICSIGQMLHHSWTLKRSLADGVSTDMIDDIYVEARAHGAVGGKLLGAGGGGFMLLFVPPEHHAGVREALKNLVEVSFKIGAPGSSVVLYEPEGL